MRHLGPVGYVVELLVALETMLVSVILLLLSVELVLLTDELVLAIELLLVVASLVEVVCCVVVWLEVVDVVADAVVVTLDNVPVKVRFWVCGMPRCPVSTVTCSVAVNWPFSVKVNESPELQFCGEQAESEYVPPLVKTEPTFTPLSHG